MTDKRRAENDRNGDRSPELQRDELEEERDDLARRRELARQAQLTNREREERWPIG